MGVLLIFQKRGGGPACMPMIFIFSEVVTLEKSVNLKDLANLRRFLGISMEKNEKQC